LMTARWDRSKVVSHLVIRDEEVLHDDWLIVALWPSVCDTKFCASNINMWNFGTEFHVQRPIVLLLSVTSPAVTGHYFRYSLTVIIMMMVRKWQCWTRR
jgi:hypothetical protein